MTKEKNKVKLKNTINKILNILILFFFFITVMVLVIGVVAIKSNKPMMIFGYTYSVVPTESMEPEIKAGDFVISKKVDYDELKIGDDIVYYSNVNKIYIIHRIIRIDEKGIKTKGINPIITAEDSEYVTRDNYVAKAVWHGNILNLGNVVSNYRSIIFLIFIIIFLVIIISEIINIIHVRNEQVNEKALKELEQINEKEEKLREEIRKELENNQNSIK